MVSKIANKYFSKYNFFQAHKIHSIDNQLRSIDNDLVVRSKNCPEERRHDLTEKLHYKVG
jgi:hypothetical protein